MGTLATYMALVRSQVDHTPYVYGGATLDVGVDCSGLLYAAAQAVGVQIPRDTEEQWAAAQAHTGNMMTVASPIPGDCIYFEVPSDAPSAPPQHVGMYIGVGHMIDAPHTGDYVSQEIIPNVPGVIWPIGYARITGFAASPAPLPPTQESTMVSQTVSSTPGQLDVFQIKGGALFHYWKANAPGWGVESINERTGCKATFPEQVPQVVVLDGQVMVTVEDSGGNAWYFAQTSGQKDWGVNAL